MNKAVFFDRDNTLNEDPGYLSDPEKVKLFPGVAEGIRKLKDKYGFLIIVISNQSGIARGLMTEEDVISVNDKINFLLGKHNTKIDKFYFCPFHPDFSDENDCKCRKPSPEMVFKAKEEFNIDLSKSYFVGDKDIDVECGNNAGLKTVLLKHSKELSKNDLHNGKKTPNFVAGNFLEACNWIIDDYTGGNPC